jgi:hypothetical protein
MGDETSPRPACRRGARRLHFHPLGTPAVAAAIIVVFDEALSGTIDVPAQGKAGVALKEITIAPPRVHFELPIDDGKAVFEGVLRGDTISGSFTQGPLAATFSIQRSAAP